MSTRTKKAPTAMLWPDEIRPAVTILINAGVINPNGRGDRFIGSVPAGTVGAYVGPANLPDWHYVDVTTDKISGYAPLHASQFTRQRRWDCWRSRPTRSRRPERANAHPAGDHECQCQEHDCRAGVSCATAARHEFCEGSKPHVCTSCEAHQ